MKLIQDSLGTRNSTWRDEERLFLILEYLRLGGHLGPSQYFSLLPKSMGGELDQSRWSLDSAIQIQTFHPGSPLGSSLTESGGSPEQRRGINKTSDSGTSRWFSKIRQLFSLKSRKKNNRSNTDTRRNKMSYGISASHEDTFKSALFAELGANRNQIERLQRENTTLRETLERTRTKLRDVYTNSRKVSNDVDEALYA